MSDPDPLAAGLPDLPRWVETRSMLLHGTGRVRRDEGGALVICEEDPLASVVGRPSAELLRGAVADRPGNLEILCQTEDRDHVAAALPEWKDVPMRIHTLRPGAAAPATPPGIGVRLLRPGDDGLLADLPPEWKRTMELCLPDSLAAVSFLEGEAASFCAAPARTETLWDVSVITRESHRRRGCATPCCVRMIRHMRREGREPVWGTAETNTASLRLAARLGFEETDRLFIFIRRALK